MSEWTDDSPSLGPCCNCGTTENVVNVVMLDRRGPQPGFGWGCVVCDLPSDGAVAVLCEGCIGQAPQSVCEGYPQDGKRVPIDKLPVGSFEHDPNVAH